MCNQTLSVTKKQSSNVKTNKTTTTTRSLEFLTTDRHPIIDIICFLAPLAFMSVTNIIPVYLTGNLS